MIYRTYNPELANRIANTPEVKATFGLHLRDNVRPIDLTECCNRDDYFLLTNDIDACALFIGDGPAVFDGHSLFDTSCRGRDAISTGKQFLEWMWLNTQAKIIYGKTPVENRKARWFNRQIGFSSDGLGPFHGPHGIWDAEWFSATRPQ